MVVGKSISHYKIIEKLGEGGMGVVYKAEDTKLKRTVALKFLPRHLLANEEDKIRFLHEAQAASALNHPNILTIHEIDEVDGETFIAMEYAEGETLKDRLEKRPLKTKELVNIAILVADGLKAAHDQDIVHRDIKSENIIITKTGQVKILDFGLAKRSGISQFTRPGSTVGTLAYMSPEQVEGIEVDRRSDLFSFGVVLYEMATGKLPFKGEHEAAIMYSIVNEDPPPVSKLNPNIHTEVERIIHKALEKDRKDRSQHADEVVVDLKRLKKELESGSTKELVTKALLPPSIAVLPFVNMSPDPENEYFSDGLAEEVINALTKIKDLRVSSRTSTFSFKGKLQDIREVGKTLNVETVLEGSVRKADNRLRVIAQLINVADGYHLWSERYDRELKDVFEIQDDITENIVQALQVVLSPKEKRALEKVPTPEVEAYDFYLRGRKFFHQFRRKSFEFALQMFDRAIQIDPSYALAHAGIADCHSYLYMYWESSQGNLRKAEEASQKALQLDPQLAEAHVARGLAVSMSTRYKEAETEFETALQLNPKLFEAYFFYGRTCAGKGKLEKAAELLEKAYEVNPADYKASALLAQTYTGLGQETKAQAARQRTIEIIERHLTLNPDDTQARCLGAGHLIKLGQRERGLEWAQRALEMDPEDPAVLYNVACAYSLAGEIEKTFDCLERAGLPGYASKEWKEWIEHDSDLDPIRTHPRYKALLA